ncbi:MAG: DNA polymerase IV [Bacilli bacterium]|nr:DNA polymerase IV [Bacilli bacterium]
MERIILHIDVNNAFLSWTAVSLLKQGFFKDIREEYSVIGGDEKKRHGIVLAKSNLCKQTMIKTGEPLYSARKKCPLLKIYPPDYNLYEQMSNTLFSLLFKYSPDIEILSIDECFLDYTKVKNLYGDVFTFTKKVQCEIKEKLGFTVNIGIANNKLCAKMASDFSKPNKIHTLFTNEIENKLWTLEVDDLYGIGKKSAVILHSLNIHTIYDLAHANENILRRYFKNQTNKIIDLARGIDNSPVDSSYNSPKGISKSTTLPYDCENKEEALAVLNQLVEEVSTELRRQGKYAKVIAVFYKNNFFKTFSKQNKLKNATAITEEINDKASSLFMELWQNDPIRLIGIRLDQLVDIDYYQISLFEDIKIRDNISEIDKVIDNINTKYGTKIVKKANLLKKEIKKH